MTNLRLDHQHRVAPPLAAPPAPPAPNVDGADAFRIAVLRSEKDEPYAVMATWDQLAGSLANARAAGCTLADCKGHRCKAKYGPSWSPATFGDGRRRRDAETGRGGPTSLSLAAQDVDGATEEAWQTTLAGLKSRRWAAIWHGSHSDRIGGRGGLRSLRLVLVPDRPILASEWPAVTRGLAAELGTAADEKAMDAGRIFFLPSRPSDGPQVDVGRLAGTAFPVDAMAARGAALVAPRPAKGAARDDGDGTSAEPWILEEAWQRLLRHGPSIRGRGGDRHAYTVGSILLVDFDLPWSQAWPLAVRWNDEVCGATRDDGDGRGTVAREKWDEGKLEQKLRNGERYATGTRGSERTNLVLGAEMTGGLDGEQVDAKGANGVHVGVAVALAGGGAPAGFGAADGPQKPTVEVVLDVETMADAAGKLLAADEDERMRLYQRGGEAVQVSIGRGRVQTRAASATSFLARLSRLARWRRIVPPQGKREGFTVDEHPSDSTIKRTMETQVGLLRELAGTIGWPALRSDGTARTRSGWDPQTRWYVHLGSDLEGAPFSMGHGIAAARGAFDELALVFKEFPFADEAVHRAAAVALVCSMACRSAFGGTVPFFVIDAPQKDSGKTLLCEAAHVLCTGRTITKHSLGDGDERTIAKITTILRAAPTGALIDNVARAFGGEFWDVLGTSEEWGDRKMATHDSIEVPNTTVWMVTGSAMSFVGDATKRICPIRIEPGMARPGLRRFKQDDLLGWIRRERPRLLTAALTLVGAYLAEGSPGAISVPGSAFDPWSRCIRSAVRWAGGADPWGGRLTYEDEADPQEEAKRLLAARWAHVLGDTEVTAAELAATPDAGLRDALVAVCRPSDGRLTAASVGARLRGLKGRTVPSNASDLRFERTEDKDHGSRWRVVKV